MDDFIDSINFHINTTMETFDNQKVYQAENNLKIWQNNQNKHLVTNFYPDIHFGYCYTRTLFRSRVESFYEVLKDVSSNIPVKEAMLNDSSITSIGCGSGADIVAYIVFMRDHLNCKMRLNFIAIDEIKYWVNFLQVIANKDRNVTISFKNKKFTSADLNNGNCQGICIMSYPEAVNFGNIWQQFTNKYRLIIILDQSKYSLHDQWTQAGFRIVPFYYKGDKKYGYYLSDRRITMDYVESDGGEVIAEVEKVDDSGFWNMLSKCTIL